MEYFFHVLVIAGIYSVLSLNLNLVLGYAGLPLLGYGSFFCIGAYASAILSTKFSIPVLLCLCFSGAISSLASLVISMPVLKLKGDYLALSTFGFGIITYSVSNNWLSLTRGPLGIPGIPGLTILNWSFSSPGLYCLIVYSVVILCYWFLRQIVDSPLGRVLRGIREDEIVILTLGKAVWYYKIQVLLVACFFAGTAGSLYAHYITFIDPSSFTVTESLTVLLMVIFGGLGNLLGSIMGAISLVVLPEAMRFLGVPNSISAILRQILYGLLLTSMMIWRPQGILGRINK
jgi:branched-chain amino acid transport system permease protein